MNLLLVNDDGIESEGILALARRLSEKHNVTVVAPLHNQSAKSHSATFSLLSYEDRGVIDGIHYYALDGTPSDCTRFALTYLNVNSDLIISGINNGVNVGYDVFLSGTVAAAMEANFFQKPAIALSVYYKRLTAKVPVSFDNAIDYITSNLDRLYQKIQGTSVTLNINVPMGEILGERICPHANSVYKAYNKEVGDQVDVQMWQDFDAKRFEGTDIGYAERGYVAITPLKTNLSDLEMIEKWEKM